MQDPLADKIFLIFATGSAGWVGLIPALPSVVLALSHGTLVAGSFYKRAEDLRWKWKDMRAFFKVKRNINEILASSETVAEKVTPTVIGKILTVMHYIGLGYVCADAAYKIDTHTLKQEEPGILVHGKFENDVHSNVMWNCLAIMTFSLIPLYSHRKLFKK